MRGGGKHSIWWERHPNEPGLRKTGLRKSAGFPDGLLSPSVPNEKDETCLSEEERSNTLVLMGTPRSSLRRSAALIWKRLGRDNLLRQRVHLSWFIAPDRCQILAFGGGLLSLEGD